MLMDIKIKIEPGTPAEEMFQKYMEQKAETLKKLDQEVKNVRKKAVQPI